MTLTPLKIARTGMRLNGFTGALVGTGAVRNTTAGACPFGPLLAAKWRGWAAIATTRLGRFRVHKTFTG
jgi:hypothetical protein